MTKFSAFNSLTDARWTEDHSAATHLRSPMTLTWVEMKPPVPIAALVYQQPGDFWHRFGDWCKAAWDVGRCDPTELAAGPVLPDGHGGWISEPKQCCEWHNRNCEPPSELCCGNCTEIDHPYHEKLGPCSSPDQSAHRFGAHLTDEQREDLGRGLAGMSVFLQRQNEIMARNMARCSPLKREQS